MVQFHDGPTPAKFKKHMNMCSMTSVVNCLKSPHPSVLLDVLVERMKAVRGAIERQVDHNDIVDTVRMTLWSRLGGMIVYQSIAKPVGHWSKAIRVYTLIWDSSRPPARILWVPTAKMTAVNTCDGHYLTVLDVSGDYIDLHQEQLNDEAYRAKLASREARQKQELGDEEMANAIRVAEQYDRMMDEAARQKQMSEDSKLAHRIRESEEQDDSSSSASYISSDDANSVQSEEELENEARYGRAHFILTNEGDHSGMII